VTGYLGNLLHAMLLDNRCTKNPFIVLQLYRIFRLIQCDKLTLEKIKGTIMNTESSD